MMQEAEATGTVLFFPKLSTCTSTVSWSSCSTRTRLSKAASRPVWSVSPKARKNSGDLCVQRMVGLPQTTQAQQGHVFGGFHALVQQSSQASGHQPRLAREFKRSAARGDFKLAAYRLADRRMSSAEAALSGEQLMQLAGSSPLWGLAALPRAAVASLPPRDTVDVWNVQRVLRAQSRTSCHWLHGQSTHLIVHLGSLAGRTQSSKRRGSSSAQQKCRDAKSAAPYKWWLEAVCQRQRSTYRQENLLRGNLRRDGGTPVGKPHRHKAVPVDKQENVLRGNLRRDGGTPVGKPHRHRGSTW